MQSYLVRTRHHNIVVDTCIGNHKHRPTRPLWHLKEDARWMSALAGHGLSVEDVDFVMCTHLHPDHVGWNTRLDGGRWVPTFPNARDRWTPCFGARASRASPAISTRTACCR